MCAKKSLMNDFVEVLFVLLIRKGKNAYGKRVCKRKMKLFLFSNYNKLVFAPVSPECWRKTAIVVIFKQPASELGWV